MRREATKRRRRHLEEENHERWLISYADFITLLFAFFVVMYSISSVSEGKYRVLSETLNLVFGEQSVEVPRRPPASETDPLLRQIEYPDPEAPAAEPSDDEMKDPLRDRLEQHALRSLRKAVSQQRVYDELAISLESWLDQGLIDLRLDGDRIEVEMNARLLFSSGETRLSDAAMQALRLVGRSLTRIPNPIQVEGFTDNVPISNHVYQSNWELSAARAATVVEFLGALGVAPERLAAVGRGQYQPIADNSTAQGRAANRRVSLMILGSEQKVFDPDGLVPWAEGPAVDGQ